MTEKSVNEQPKGDIYKFESKDGKFERQVSSFRDWVSTEEGAKFPPQKGRYVSPAKISIFSGSHNSGKSD